MRLSETFSFACPLKINCGSHALDHLPSELLAVGAKAPLILANREQIGKKGLRTVIDAFKTSGMTLGVYDRLTDQPQKDLLPVLAKMYRDGGCDSLIGVGHGPVVDMAKCLNASCSNDNDRTAEHAAAPTGLLGPLMLVVTPGGNGYEVTGHAWDGEHRFQRDHLVPSAAFIDPKMMKAGGNEDLAGGALIGLAHAVEAFLDETAGPMCRAYAHTAIGLIIKYLPAALRKKERAKSMCAVVNGQVAAGCAFAAASPGIGHTLGTGLEENSDLPLGFLLAVLLPHLVEHAGSQSPEVAGGLLYPMVGEDIFAITAPDLKVSRAMALLWEFFDAVGAELDHRVPSSLVETGLSDEQVEGLLSRIERGPDADRAAHIIGRAKSKPFRS